MLLSVRNLFFTTKTTKVTNRYVGTVYAMFFKIRITFGYFFSFSTASTAGKKI